MSKTNTEEVEHMFCTIQKLQKIILNVIKNLIQRILYHYVLYYLG